MHTRGMVVLVLTAFPATAAAQGITAFWQQNAITSAAVAADPILGNMQSWSLMATTTGNWASAGLEAVLAPGNTFYNPSLGGNTKSHPALVAAFPNLAFDTYVTSPGDNGISGAPTILGEYPEGPGPGDFGGTSGRFAVSWGDLAVDPPGSYEIARLTFPLGPAVNVRDYVSPSLTSQVSPDSTALIPRIPLPRVTWAEDADGSWHLPSNWSSNPALPGFGDNVLIDVGGATVRTITHSQGTTKVRSIESFEKIVLNGGTLEAVDFMINRGGLEISGGTLVGTSVSWEPITFGPAGGRLVRVTSNAGLRIPDNTTVLVNQGLNIGYATLANGATLRFQGTQVLGWWGSVTFRSGGVIQLDGGTELSTFFGMNLVGRGGVIGARTPGTSGPTTLVNAGRIWAEAGSLAIEADMLLNSGTIGSFAGGASVFVNGSLFSSTGHVEVPSGSTISISASFVSVDGVVGGNGVVRALNSMTVNGPLRKTGTGVLRVNRTLAVGAGGALDFVAGNIVNDYVAASPIADLRASLASGYDGGTWLGMGIKSSTAASIPGLAVGYAEASVLFTAFPATFAGETIDDTTVVMRLTRFGDADLSGHVDLSDFNRLAANFNEPGVWSDGDFNYDGVVNLPDFNLLAANFNLSAASGGPTPLDWANLASAIPEPAAVGLLFAGAILRRHPRMAIRRYRSP